MRGYSDISADLLISSSNLGLLRFATEDEIILSILRERDRVNKDLRLLVVPDI